MFTVRQTTSGYNGVTKYLVYNGSKRVSVHAYITRESAQAQADDLNIGALVKPYDEDPRPYPVRLAEAREEFYKNK